MNFLKINLPMDLTLILGPMKSGKSFELISHFAPLKYTSIPFILYQPEKNVRDTHIQSRNGVAIEATKAKTLEEALKGNYGVVGIDEANMFDESEADVVEKLLQKGTEEIAFSLDMDHQARLFGLVRRLLELGPKEVRYRRAVCEMCKTPNAVHTQVFKNGVPVTEEVPPATPDDGTFEYKTA